MDDCVNEMELQLRELMLRDAKVIGKLDDIRRPDIKHRIAKGKLGQPWKELGISRSVYYERLRKRISIGGISRLCGPREI